MLNYDLIICENNVFLKKKQVMDKKMFQGCQAAVWCCPYLIKFPLLHMPVTYLF